MPALHVRDVPQSVMTALRERAQKHGQSVQQEVRQILAAAASAAAEGEPVEALRLIPARGAGASSWGRDEIYGSTGR